MLLPFVPSEVLSSFFVRPWLSFLEYISSQCHVCFPHSEYWTRLIFISFYLTLLINNSTLCIPHTSELYKLCTSASHIFVLVLGTILVHFSVPACSGNSIRTSVRNTLDATEGRHSTQAEANSRKPPNFRTSGLDFQRTWVAWATHNTPVCCTPWPWCGNDLTWDSGAFWLAGGSCTHYLINHVTGKMSWQKKSNCRNCIKLWFRNKLKIQINVY